MAESIYMQDLSKVTGLTSGFWRSLFQHAAEYYQAEPWNVCDTRDVIEIQAYGQSRVIQQRSNWSEIAVGLWRSFDHYWDIFNPRMGRNMNDCIENAVSKHRPREAGFERAEDIDRPNRKFIKKLGLVKSGAKFYPMFMGFGFTLDAIDFKLYDLCFQLLPAFCSKLEPETPYELAPLEETMNIKTALGERVTVKLIFPAGRRPTADECFDMLPQSVACVVPIPAQIRTYGQMVEHFRNLCGKMALPSEAYLRDLDNKQLKRQLRNSKIDLTGCLDRADLLAAAENQRYQGSIGHLEKLRLVGLTNTLWKLRTKDTTLEAIEISKFLIDLEPADPLGARYSLLEMYMELNMWQSVQDLLGRFDHADCMTWAWTKALVTFKQHGGDSERAKNALFAAVKLNGIVVKYLTDEARDVLTADVNVIVDIGEGSGQRELDAKEYFDIYMPYWRRVKGSIEWVRTQGAWYRELHYTGNDLCSITSVMTITPEQRDKMTPKLQTDLDLD